MHVCKEVEEKLISCKIGKDTHCLVTAQQHKYWNKKKRKHQMKEGKEWEKKANNLDRKWYIFVAINVSFPLIFLSLLASDNIGNEFMYARFWGQKLTMLLNSIHTASNKTSFKHNELIPCLFSRLEFTELQIPPLSHFSFYFSLASGFYILVKNWKIMLERKCDDDVLKKARTMVAEKLFS